MSVREVLTRCLPWMALAVALVFAFVQLRERRRAEDRATGEPVLSRTVPMPDEGLEAGPVPERDLVPGPAPIRAPAQPTAPAPDAPDPEGAEPLDLERPLLARVRARMERAEALRAVAEERSLALAAENAALRERLAVQVASSPAPGACLPEAALARWRAHADAVRGDDPGLARAARAAAAAADAGDAVCLAGILLDEPGRAVGVALLVAAFPLGPATDALTADLVTSAPDAESAEARLRTLGAVRVLRPRVLDQLLAPGADSAHTALLVWATDLDARWTEVERAAFSRALAPRVASDDDRVAAVARRFQARLGLTWDLADAGH